MNFLHKKMTPLGSRYCMVFTATVPIQQNAFTGGHCGRSNAGPEDACTRVECYWHILMATRRRVDREVEGRKDAEELRREVELARASGGDIGVPLSEAVDYTLPAMSLMSRFSPKSKDGGIRYDGYYRTSPEMSEGVEYADYLRFFSDGIVIYAAFRNPSNTQQLRELFARGSIVPHGKFEVKAGRVSFKMFLARGVIDYDGQIDGERLILSVHSHINQRSHTDFFNFIPW